MRGYWDYFNLALHWLCLTAPHLLRRVAAGVDRGGRFYQSEWPLRQGTRGRWRGLYAFGIRTKLKIWSDYPYMYDFSLRMVLFQDEKVSASVNDYLAENFDTTFDEYFKNIDFSRFKEDIDPKYIYKMFSWLSEGYLSEKHRTNQPIVFEEAIAEFEKWKAMIKQISYKEEYL